MIDNENLNKTIHTIMREAGIKNVNQSIVDAIRYDYVLKIDFNMNTEQKNTILGECIAKYVR